ncbi:MAG: phosphatidylinositol-specific phospholipase C domain-containing protein, partial [Bacilli bacterium]|nr:phosphatidylinositol-specific phospholipase C domain-containing protein [Bacilli bacterium]
TFINNIVIPGSHDAGTNGMSWLGETQNLSIKDQLNEGVRYFDIRVNKKSKDNYVIFHSVINGCRFEPILNDIKDFIIANPTETILLDFQHFKNNSEEGVLSLINEYLLSNNLIVRNTTANNDLEFISNLKLSDTRGKCLIFWGNRDMSMTYDYLFARNNDTCEYQNMSLDSYYHSDFHKKFSPTEFINQAIPFYFEDIKRKITEENYKGIFVLQCQLTDGALIFGPYSKEKKMSNVMEQYLSATIALNSDYISLLNVIMRDFISFNKANTIIGLNFEKNNLKEALKSEFIYKYCDIVNIDA